MFVLTLENKKCEKLRFKKVTSSPLPGFWANAQPTIQMFAWNFVHWLLLYNYILYIAFFRYLQKFWCGRNLFVKNRSFDFGGTKTKYFENSRYAFCRTFNLEYLGVFSCFLLKNLHFRSRWILAVFRPKITWHDVTKTPFSLNF